MNGKPRNYILDNNNNIRFEINDNQIRLSPIYEGRISLTKGYPSGFCVILDDKDRTRLLFVFHLYWENEWINEKTTAYWVQRNEEMKHADIQTKITTIVCEMIERVNELWTHG